MPSKWRIWEIWPGTEAAGGLKVPPFCHGADINTMKRWRQCGTSDHPNRSLWSLSATPHCVVMLPHGLIGLATTLVPQVLDVAPWK